MLRVFFLAILFLFSTQAFALTTKGKYFDRVITVIFENKNYADAMKQPFFAELAKKGANFSNFLALTHPSQPNYIALTSGSTYNVKDDQVVNLNVNNIVDLLEAKNVSWKVYAEEYPGNCYTKATSKNYARKHNPFISYLDIQKNPARCANIVNANQFDQDAASGNLPSYVFYVPNNKNNGHDTTVAFSDKWYRQKFGPYVADSQFMQNTILISTFDESEPTAPRNQIYTSVVGSSVVAGNYADSLNIYSLLNMVEDNWNLGSLGQGDATARPVPNIWR